MLKTDTKSWRILLLLLLFLTAQLTLLVHQQDLSLHGDGAACGVCLHVPASGSLTDASLLVITHGYLVERLSFPRQLVPSFPHRLNGYLSRAPPANFS